MKTSFQRVLLNEIKEQLKQHLSSLPSKIDSFLESHILESTHYKISVSEVEAGFASIHKGSLITQFVLLPEYKRYGQAAFSRLKKLEEVQSAFVATCDEFFLSHALDDYRNLAKQAYFFASPCAYTPDTETPYALRQALESDIEFIRQNSGDFFGDDKSIQHKVESHELFLNYLADTCVGFGIIEKSQLINLVASIGMFVITEHRQKGVGTDTLRLLKAKCQSQNLEAIAGCWYYNHLSKKTLERAGMSTQTRLLKIDF